MNIIVCIKQVPDTTEIKIDPVKGTLIREGVPSIMNPDDKGGLELAQGHRHLDGTSASRCHHARSLRHGCRPRHPSL